ncbi:unnamed protein product [Colias eurytheme]|nr:unnamed protein product [Colias eurytheme]
MIFPLKIEEIIEDPVFITPPGVKRPRVYITLKIRGAATMGTIAAELFNDVCPNTCKLFLDLLDGDGVGYGYVGTRFFRYACLEIRIGNINVGVCKDKRRMQK